MWRNNLQSVVYMEKIPHLKTMKLYISKYTFLFVHKNCCKCYTFLLLKYNCTTGTLLFVNRAEIHRLWTATHHFDFMISAAFICSLGSVTCSFSSSLSRFLVCAVTQGLSVAVQAVVYYNHTPLSSSSGNWGPELNRLHCHNIKDKYRKYHSQGLKNLNFIQLSFRWKANMSSNISFTLITNIWCG